MITIVVIIVAIASLILGMNIGFLVAKRKYLGFVKETVLVNDELIADRDGLVVENKRIKNDISELIEVYKKRNNG